MEQTRHSEGEGKSRQKLIAELDASVPGRYNEHKEAADVWTRRLSS